MKSLDEKIEEIEKLILPCNFPIHHSTEECTGQTVHLAWRKIEPAIKSLINQEIKATLDKAILAIKEKERYMKPYNFGSSPKEFYALPDYQLKDLKAKIAKIKKELGE